jgi:hypothetical protein
MRIVNLNTLSFWVIHAMILIFRVNKTTQYFRFVIFRIFYEFVEHDERFCVHLQPQDCWQTKYHLLPKSLCTQFSILLKAY